MNLIWNSQKGINRENNNDYCLFFESKTHYVLTLIDVSERVKGKVRELLLSEVLAVSLIEEIKKILNVCDVDGAFRLVFDKKRSDFIGEIGCYLVLVIDKGNPRKGIIYNLGDCRVAKKIGENYEWLNQVDTFEENSSVLIKCFKLTRFHQPEKYELNNLDEIYLATDGFWRDFIINKEEEIIDDRSVLIINSLDEDCVNIKLEGDKNFKHIKEV